MSEAREQILAGIRRSLKRGRLDATHETALRERVTAHRRNLVPARAAALDDPGRIDLFAAMAEEVQATVTRVDSPAAGPGEVARYLAAHTPTERGELQTAIVARKLAGGQALHENDTCAEISR